MPPEVLKVTNTPVRFSAVLEHGHELDLKSEQVRELIRADETAQGGRRSNAGKRADLILVDGDPLVNVGDLRRTKLVIKGSAIYDGDALAAAAGLTPEHSLKPRSL